MELKETILKLSEAFTDLKTKYPISKLGVFGSVARGEALESSDVDILVEFNAPIGLKFVALAEELEVILKKKVDLVSLNGIKDRYKTSVLEDTVYV